MPHLILARHGETEINVRNRAERVYYGRQESPLTQLGREQARMLGTELAARTDIRLGFVASSDIGRTLETARIALRELFDPPEIVPCADLTARSLGIFEGMTREQVERMHPAYIHDPRFNDFDRDFYKRAPGGENLSDVSRRAWLAVEWARQRCDGDILLVTHATVVRCLLGMILGVPAADIPALKIPNASPVYVRRTGNCYETQDTLSRLSA